jgi:hypothetical protein
MDVIAEKTPPGWVKEALERSEAQLERSEAQIESGKIVPLEPVLDRLRASIARMKGGQKRTEPKAARKA